MRECPAGMYRNETLGESVSDCQDCLAGWVCSNTGTFHLISIWRKSNSAGYAAIFPTWSLTGQVIGIMV